MICNSISTRMSLLFYKAGISDLMQQWTKFVDNDGGCFVEQKLLVRNLCSFENMVTYAKILLQRPDIILSCFSSV